MARPFLVEQLSLHSLDISLNKELNNPKIDKKNPNFSMFSLLDKEKKRKRK